MLELLCAFALKTDILTAAATESECNRPTKVHNLLRRVLLELH